eukprot:CAMPEP_0169111820 /NCGR_PEP_ID=MMETSP1015-20121227/27283_1 /TAXON_ID=342587 /ORGANISM="Karlodinium micrum, Strain CCMP2283" /LENGTH=113 /DNA_ID=CAMNT_0009173771 /DNA_START=98 /DNA_END=440 /DNA_ORIENTATION=-
MTIDCDDGGLRALSDHDYAVLTFAFGINDKRVAMKLMSVLPHVSLSEYANASASLPNSTSTIGMTSMMAVLKQGTCIKNGAARLKQYLAPDFAASLAANCMESMDAVTKKPAL